MFKYFIKGFFAIFILTFITGCKTTSGVEVRAYIQEEKRLDQQLDGNSGYLIGSPKNEELVPRKTTRKTYVLEISKEASQNQKIEYQENIPKKYNLNQEKSNIQEDENLLLAPDDYYFEDDIVIIPSYEDEVNFQDETNLDMDLDSYVNYTVQSEDTLQKISKKFYDSYSKWLKIYEVNKTNIKDPNYIKPGTILRIPMEQ